MFTAEAHRVLLDLAQSYSGRDPNIGRAIRRLIFEAVQPDPDTEQTILFALEALERAVLSGEPVTDHHPALIRAIENARVAAH